MNTLSSEQINDLAAALAKAQGEMEGAKKDQTNPHFKSKYADLASVWDAVRAPLSKHGLSIAQFPRLTCYGESAWMLDLETRLMHQSGQWLSDTLSVPISNLTAQGVGSAMTYARRYSLMAVAGIAPEDDDGNAAVGDAGRGQYSRRESNGGTSHVRPTTKVPISEPQQKRLHAIAKEKGWDPEQLRAHLMAMGFRATKDITMQQYDDVIASVEAGPQLPTEEEEPVL